jgi:hypothetical protein
MFRNFFFLTLVLVSSTAFAASDQQVKKAIADAKAEFKQAIAVQGGWTSTEKLLKNAEQSLAKGDKDTALKLAKQAKHEAKLSIDQAKTQQKKWSEPAYIRK